MPLKSAIGSNALAFQVGKLATDVIGQMSTWFGTGKAVVKLVQEIGEFRGQAKGSDRVSSVTPCNCLVVKMLQLTKNLQLKASHAVLLVAKLN